MSRALHEIARVDRLFKCGTELVLTDTPVCHDAFEELVRLSRTFEEEAGLQGEEAWTPVLQAIRRLRFDLCAAPLPLSGCESARERARMAIEKVLPDCRIGHPRTAAILTRLHAHLGVLSAAADNPLLDGLEVIGVSEAHLLTVMVKESRLRQPAADMLTAARLPVSRVIVPTDLQAVEDHAHLVLVGSASWFPDFVFSSCRTRRISVLRYGCIASRFERRPMLGDIPSIRGHSAVTVPVVTPVWRGSPVVPDDLLSRRAVDEIARDEGRRLPDADSSGVDARLFLLADGNAAWIEGTDDASIFAVNPAERTSGPRAAKLRRTLVRNLQPGMFVVLRTDSSRDYIQEAADAMLGGDAPALRIAQQRWKEPLQAAVDRDGIRQVMAALRALGSARPSEQNVRNWTRRRLIKPQAFADFHAVMALGGNAGDAKSLWHDMCRIHRSHLHVGRQVRQKLMQQVDVLAPEIFSRQGRVDILLPGEDDVRLTAYRIEEISSVTQTVPESRVNEPFVVD